jgi:hypothetical protein
MNMKTFKFALVLAVSLMLCVANSYAANITIWDKMGSGESKTSFKEDGEVEPNCVWDQRWDLERFNLNGYELTMIGGYNFQGGYGGYSPGDIFIDTSTPLNAQYGGTTGGYNNTTVTNQFGYDYVLKLNFTALTYDVISLNANSKVKTAFYLQNQGSNPWIYVSGGVLESTGNRFQYDTGLSTYEDLVGASHNAVTVDLSFLGANKDFIVHYTYQCGNDDLMGQGRTPVPEPTTLLLLGLGLLGLGVSSRKLRK